MLTSIDGQTWDWHSIAGSERKQMQNVIWAHNQYLALASSGDWQHGYTAYIYKP